MLLQKVSARSRNPSLRLYGNAHIQGPLVNSRGFYTIFIIIKLDSSVAGQAEDGLLRPAGRSDFSP